MNRPLKNHNPQAGFSMIEVMVSLVILLLGLLGLVGLIVVSQRAETESYQRSQALLLLQDIVGRINANRRVATCYAITTDTVNGVPYLGKGSTLTPACGFGTTQANTLATSDLSAWSGLLTGTAETLGGSNLGAMVGARGCVSYDATTELVDPATGATTAGTGLYTVAVAWQGLNDTITPTTNCANGLYGSELKRRVVGQAVPDDAEKFTALLGIKTVDAKLFQSHVHDRNPRRLIHGLIIPRNHRHAKRFIGKRQGGSW